MAVVHAFATPNHANYSDSFNRANAADLGANWTEESGTNYLKIASNNARPTTAWSMACASYKSAAMSNGHGCSVVSGPTEASAQQRCYVRSNSSNQVFAQWNNNVDKCYIGTRTGSPLFGSGTVWRASSGGNIAWVAGDTLAFEAVGNVYTAKKNGDVVVAWTDTSYATYPFVDASHRTMAIAFTGATTEGVDSWSGYDLIPVYTPPVPAVRAIDWTYNSNALDANWFSTAYAQGYRLFIMATTGADMYPQFSGTFSQTPTYLGRALDAGFKVAAYSRDITLWHDAITVCGAHQADLQFFALDAEQNNVFLNPGWSTAPVTQTMVDGVTALGVRPVVYSASWAWSTVQGSNDLSFQTVPMWDAASGSMDLSLLPTMESPAPTPFGGWNTGTNPRKGAQQRTDYSPPWNTVAGANFDFDSFRSDFLI